MHPSFAKATLEKVLPAHDPEKLALGLDPGVVFRFSEKMMHRNKGGEAPTGASIHGRALFEHGKRDRRFSTRS
jgi:hypothetical protein